MRYKYDGILIYLFGLAIVASIGANAQTVIKNPSGLAFICADHASDIAHEVAIVRESDGAIIQTISGGDPPLTGAEVIIPLNVMPVAFGRYRFKARVGGDSPYGVIWSEWSELSDLWERAPGKATDLRVIAK